MPILRPDQIEEAISARISALSGTDYAQGSYTPSWTESDVALTPDNQAEGRGLGHLLYWVLAQGAQPMDDRQPAGGRVLTQSRVLVSFLYHLRPTYQRADQRLAAQAAHDVAVAVKALPQDEWWAQLADRPYPARRRRHLSG